MSTFYKNPLEPTMRPERSANDADLTDSERSRLLEALKPVVTFLVMLSLFSMICLFFCTCSSGKKIVEQHHYHEVSDTAAVRQQVDGRLSMWQASADSLWQQRWSQYSSELLQQEQEKERITETVTMWVDSLGREVRQEQRTTERDISRRQEQREERLVQEFEARMQSAIARQDSIWQLRIDAVVAHYEQIDSIANLQEPVRTAEPSAFKIFMIECRIALIVAAVFLLLLWSSKWWLPIILPLLKRIF